MADIFMGYILTNGKQPLSSVKNKDNWLPEPPESHDYAGILRENIIQLDFDSDEEFNIILKIVDRYKLKCDILKTSRGGHLYFINDIVQTQSVAVFNAVGLKCDIGLGSKNRIVPLRVTKDEILTKIINGVETEVTTRKTVDREWLQTYEQLDTLPAYFRPIGKKDYELPKSNTRNQTMFNYILTLQVHNFSKSEVRQTIKIINDFIVYERLPDKDVDTITRDDAFSEEIFFNERGNFLHDRFGNYMLTNANIMKLDEQVCIYTDDFIYSNNPDDFEKAMLKKIPSLKDSQRKEVYKYITLKVVKKGEYASPRYLGLKSSILDIESKEEIPYSPNWIINNRINYNYNPEAYSEVMDKTLNKVACNDPQIRSLIEEMIGYTLYRKNSMQVAFILTGEGSNGKSTILNVIKKLLGKQNYTSLDLRELEDTFKPSELYNKLANIGDDISPKYLDNSSVFKKVVTGESFIAQRKYAQPFELESYATQIFCANELPPVNDRSDGFSRRLVIVPFNANFKRTDPDYDPFVEEKLMEESAMEYLLKISIEGLQRVIMGRGFTKSDVGEKEKSEYLIYNNNVLEWLETEPKIENESTNDVYMAYQVWCARSGCKPVKKVNLSKEIKKYLHLTSKPRHIDGKTCRVYEKE